MVDVHAVAFEEADRFERLNHHSCEHFIELVLALFDLLAYQIGLGPDFVFGEEHFVLGVEVPFQEVDHDLGVGLSFLQKIQFAVLFKLDPGLV